MSDIGEVFQQMSDAAAKDARPEPTRAAMEAAVKLEIEHCIGAITTRGLAQKLEEVATALRSPAPHAEVRGALERIRDFPHNGDPSAQGMIQIAIQALAALAPHSLERGEVG